MKIKKNTHELDVVDRIILLLLALIFKNELIFKYHDTYSTKKDSIDLQCESNNIAIIW